MRRILLATVLTSPFVFSAAALATQPVSDTTASTPTLRIRGPAQPKNSISGFLTRSASTSLEA